MLMSLAGLIRRYSLDIRGVIHVGAHYGQEYNSYISNDINHLLFFEPLPKSYNILVENVHSNDIVRVCNIALGNIKGQIEMNVETANQGMSSSILEPLVHLSQYPHITFNEKITVNIDKLDNIEFDRDQFNMINIDVQGYELNVFKGAIETLPHIDYIMSEINTDYLYKDCVLVDELDKFLSDFGFERVETLMAGGNWGDALYIKKK